MANSVREGLVKKVDEMKGKKVDRENSLRRAAKASKSASDAKATSVEKLLDLAKVQLSLLLAEYPENGKVKALSSALDDMLICEAASEREARIKNDAEGKVKDAAAKLLLATEALKKYDAEH